MSLTDGSPILITDEVNTMPQSKPVSLFSAPLFGQTRSTDTLGHALPMPPQFEDLNGGINPQIQPIELTELTSAMVLGVGDTPNPTLSPFSPTLNPNCHTTLTATLGLEMMPIETSEILTAAGDYLAKQDGAEDAFSILSIVPLPTPPLAAAIEREDLSAPALPLTENLTEHLTERLTKNTVSTPALLDAGVESEAPIDVNWLDVAPTAPATSATPTTSATPAVSETSAMNLATNTDSFSRPTLDPEPNLVSEFL